MISRVQYLIVVAACLLAPDVVFSQAVVGKSIVDGKPVELLSDNTWRYRDEQDPNSDCRVLEDRVSYCNPPPGWTTLPKDSSFDLSLSLPNEFYAGVIVELLGRNRTVTMDFMRFAILENAAQDGMEAEDIPIVDIETVEVDGIRGETITYLVEFKGAQVVFSNTILLDQSLTIQAMTWSIGSDYTEEYREVTSAFLDTIEIASRSE